MELTGIDLVWLEVDSLPRAIEFYRDHLGLKVDETDTANEPPMAAVQAGQVRLMLVQEFRPMITRGRGISLFFGVTDVAEFYERLARTGLKLAPPTDDGWGGRFITVKDPDGYRLFFVTWHKSPAPPA